MILILWFLNTDFERVNQCVDALGQHKALTYLTLYTWKKVLGTVYSFENA